MLDITKTYTKWNVERISRHLLYWLAWLCFYVVVNEGAFENGDYSSWVYFELCVLPIKLSFTYFTIYYLFPKYIVKKRYSAFFVRVALLSFVGGMLFRAVDFYFISRYLVTAQSFLEKIDSTRFWTFHIAYKTIDLLFVVSLVLPVKLIQLQTRQQKKAQEVFMQKLETELQFLKHQLQPHFLFNTLNNLYAMVITGDSKSGDVVIKLSEMMSYMLYDSNVRFIDLNKELENLENYIALEKLRYGEELEIYYDVVGKRQGFQIAPLILISFVENAFKHGVSKDLSRSWIKINVQVTEDTFSFTVENTVHDEASNNGEVRVKSGFGLANVKKRLELIYGDAHALQIHNGDTYKVDLELTQKMDVTYV